MIVYVVEMILKIFSFGLFSNNNSYFKSGWNILDFFLIISFFSKNQINYILSLNLIPNFGVFRIIRIVKITPIRDFQILVHAFMKSFKLIAEVLLIFLIFMFIFSMIGVSTFKNSFKNQCLNANNGIFISEIIFCGNFNCPIKNICSKNILNPDFGLTNFDSFINSLLQNLRVVSFDDWTILMNNIQRVESNFYWIYFFVLAFIGHYFLNNFILAVIKVKFTESWNFYLNQPLKNYFYLYQEDEIIYDFKKFISENPDLLISKVSKKREITFKKNQNINTKKNFFKSLSAKEKRRISNRMCRKKNMTYSESEIKKNFRKSLGTNNSKLIEILAKIKKKKEILLSFL